MGWRFQGLCDCGQWCAKLWECSSVWQEVRRTLVCWSFWGKESLKGKKSAVSAYIGHRRPCLSSKIILVVWSRVMSPECIYRVENERKDQGYQGKRWFSGWASQMWLFVAQERDLRMFQDTLSGAARRQQSRITWRVRSPCNSCFAMIPPT